MINAKLRNALSTSGEGVIATTFSDDYGARGKKWSCNGKFTVLAGATLTFLLDLCNLPDCSNLRIDPIVFSSSATEVEMRKYEDTDYAGGDVLQCRNINRRTENADTYNFIITSGATGTDKGTQFSIHTAYGSSGNPSQPVSSGIGGNNSPYSLNKEYNYIIEFENLGDETTKVEFEGFVYES